MPYTTLVSPEILARHLDDPSWIVFDCRHDLLEPAAGERAYAAGHLPGAIHLHLERDLSGAKTGRNGRHPLPDPHAFAQRLGRLGVGEGIQVVAYDGGPGPFAARLWWLLRWMGHGAVAVLDGGYARWVAEARPVSTESRARVPKRFVERPGAVAVDAAYIEAHLGDPAVRLLDARSPERFRGENETLDPVAGHIPGAVNRHFMENLGPDGRFKPAEVLRQAFVSLLRGTAPNAVVHCCGSGVTACHNLLAMEVAGLAGSRLYPGSWSEWCTDPARPVARGD